MSEENKKVEKEAEIVTIKDFKSMLVGMDLILGDSWTPNEAQWKRIRAKIDALIETAERPATRDFYPQIPVDLSPNSSEANLLKGFPSVPSSIPAGVPVTPGPSALTPPGAPTPVQTPRAPAPVADGSGAQVKTPDIDSSKGYKSSFV